MGTDIQLWGSEGQQGAQGWKSNGAQVVTVNEITQPWGDCHHCRAAKEEATQEKTEWVVTGEEENWEGGVV